VTYLVRAEVYDRHGNQLATAYNSYVKTHPRQKRLAQRVGMPQKQYLHAEVSAIIRALKTHKAPYRICISRRSVKTGKIGLAKPCPICDLAIQEAGIQIVEYTT
jgi:tRNA(Arg) A34 adenosine deaminase TadA